MPNGSPAECYADCALHNTGLTTAKGIAQDGTVCNVQFRCANVCLMCIVQRLITSRSCIDITERATFRTDGATMDVNGCLTVHRTHGTGTVNITHNCSAIYGHRGRLLDDTGQRIIGITSSIAIRVILISTATATIDVTAIGVVEGLVVESHFGRI